MLKSIFTESTTTASLSIGSLLICFMVAIVLGIVIAFTHKMTSRYSKNFLITLSVLPMLVMSVMIMVNGNLGTSIAIVGAFSLIRFRSMPGTSKEILSVFFAMAVGLATGMGHVFFASIMTLIGALVIIILTKTNLFELSKTDKVLRITVPEDLDYEDIFKEEFEKYTNKCRIANVKLINMGSLYEVTYNVNLKSDIKEKEFIDDLRIKNGNCKIILSQSLDVSDF